MSYGMNYVRTQGTRALFAGFVPTLLRQMLGATMWFIPYEMLKVSLGGWHVHGQRSPQLDVRAAIKPNFYGTTCTPVSHTSHTS